MAQTRSSGIDVLRDSKVGTFGCYTEVYHQLFPKSAWVVIRRFGCRRLSEGDFVTAFSQFGEVVDVRCARSRKSGEIAGNCVFVKFLRIESAIMAADNMNSGKGPSGHKVFLTDECRRMGIGLQVDRCDEVEVPPMDPAVESYGEWYEREMLQP